MISRIIKFVDPPLDFVGQDLVRRLMLFIFSFGYSLALIVGFLSSDLYYTLVIGIITVVLVVVITIPPWKMYRKNPVEFVRIKEE